MYICQRIEDFNGHPERDQELVQLKCKKMKENPFVFLRGSCHLFYEDWPSKSPLNQAPLSWICGDLHLENFGSYKGENRLTYFDINDFDESVLALCTFDVTRLITSLFLAVDEIKSFSADPLALAMFFLNSYTATLGDRKARWIERDTAEGLVEKLLNDVHDKDRAKFLKKKAPVNDKNVRKIEIKEDKTCPVTSETFNNVETALRKFAESQENPDFFKVIDIVWRIAGTGSLGLKRYLVLVEGKGSPDNNYLLDLKQSIPPSLTRYISYFSQSRWNDESQRIIENQKKMQAIASALLHSLKIDTEFFVMREYQPNEDKIDLCSDNLNLDQQSLEKLMKTLGNVVAWSHLRSSGRQGAANADAFVDFSQNNWWHQEVLTYAQYYSQKVRVHHQQFQPCSVNN
ncbi:MAG: DUF2252 family protein [Snowella sp.]|nr:DUF2252 family protein [Snowella sp.]